MATEEMINEIHALVAASVLAERERIIKLLETDLLRFMYWDDDSSYAKGINLTGFIALIKGEK